MHNYDVDPRAVEASLQRWVKNIVAQTKVLKARSNLMPDPKLTLPQKDTRVGFLGLMNNAYSESPLSAINSLWVFSLFPGLAPFKKEIWGAGRRNPNKKALLKLLQTVQRPSSVVELTKGESEFLVTVPLSILRTESLTTVFAQFRALAGSAASDLYLDLILAGDLDVKTAVTQSLAPDTQRMFLSSLRRLQIKTAGDTIGVFATFAITKAEAQHMTNKSWPTIRLIDLYPLMQAWAEVGYGQDGRAPIQSFAVSAIAQTLPKDPQVLTIKVNEASIACDRNGKPLYIPRECDNTSQYEDLYAQAGRQDDNSFSLFRYGQSNTPAHLPRNIPILTDWVNARFSFSDTNGRLQVQTLSNCRAANSVHINTWLSQPLDEKLWTNVVRLIEAGTGMATVQIQQSDFNNEETRNLFRSTDISEYTAQASVLFSQIEDRPLQWSDLAHNSAHGFLRPIGRFFRQAHAQILADLDNVFAKYSVRTTTMYLPWVILCAVYSPKAGQVAAEAAAMSLPAAQQKGEPDYEVPPIPLWNEDLGFLPHQRRALELLSGSPASAILPVDAGGGKTPLAIADILINMGKGIGAPYMVLCPSHLVAQYAKELNFFTKGRMNIIPVKTRILYIHGIDRLTRIIEGAPRNTIVVVDYDAVKLRGRSVCYGTTSVNVFPVAELLKQFSFGYCLLDESHSVKNKSARSTAVLSLIADIPMKRLASGTMAHDSPSDLAIQMSVLDPTMFGSRDDFNNEYGLEIKGDRVVRWKQGYAERVTQKMKERIVVARAQRKEWAALLPPIEEFLEPVQLTENQRTVYESILEKTLEKIKADASLMKKLQEQDKTGKAKEEDDLDDFAGEDLLGLLKPHLARLETYISAPDKDPLGDELLRGDDRISTKMRPINEFIAQHEAEGRKGKILVFTNHTLVAEHIYENIDPRFKSQTLLYLAADKVEATDRFEKDPNTRIMVGVEQSLNTGLNLQAADSLIRVETVWNPGTLEQGNARLARPNLKVKEERTKVTYMWCIADRTLDVTKVSRLTAKVVAVAKYENPTNADYQALPDLEVIPLSLETIATENSWNGTLREYGEGYSEYRRLVQWEYKEYKEEFLEKYGDQFMYFPGDAGTPDDARLLSDAPYVEGLEIAGESELGLVRVDQFLRLDEQEFEGENEADVDEEELSSAWAESVKQRLIGQRIHTELGDGEIVKIYLSSRRITANIGNLQVRRIAFSNAFLLTKPLKGSVKDAQSKLTGLSATPRGPSDLPKMTKPLTVNKAVLRRQQREQERAEKEALRQQQQDLQVTIKFVNTNGFLGLRVEKETHSKLALETLSAMGFRPDVPIFRAWMKTYLMLDRQMRLWKDKGFMLDETMPETLDAFLEMYELLKSRQIDQERLTWKLANKNQLRNFYRAELKPSTDRKALKFYPLIEDMKAYIALPIRGQVASRLAIRQKAPGVVWVEAPETVSWYCLNPAQIKTMLRKIQGQMKIRNSAQLNEQYKMLRKAKARKNVLPFDVDAEE